MRPEISVIIPVYNVEKHLERCVNSVLNQTFRDFEIILVDDGSTDSSGKICDKYATENSTIRTIHKENRGPSHTRNLGVENAQGEYIYFLDSDDYIIPQCLELLYKNIKKTNADLSCGSFEILDESLDFRAKGEINNEIIEFVGRYACEKLLYGKDFYTSSCNILIDVNIAKNNMFPVGKYHEDEMTTFRYMLSASNVVKTSVRTYYYYQREGSIMHTIGQPVLDEVLAGDYYVNTCKKINDRRLLKAALCKKYTLYSTIIRDYPELKDIDPNIYDKTIKYLKQNCLGILLDISAPLSAKMEAFKFFIR